MGKVLFLCDGEVPGCTKTNCYKNDGICRLTMDATHAVNFYHMENGNMWEHNPNSQKKRDRYFFAADEIPVNQLNKTAGKREDESEYQNEDETAGKTTTRTRETVHKIRIIGTKKMRKKVRKVKKEVKELMRILHKANKQRRKLRK